MNTPNLLVRMSCFHWIGKFLFAECLREIREEVCRSVELNHPILLLAF